MNRAQRRSAAVLLLLATAGLMAASVSLTKRAATTAYRLRSAEAGEKSRKTLQQSMDDHVDALSDLSQNLESAPPANRDEYRDLAVRTAVRTPAFAAINFLDRRFVETFLYPYGVNRVLEGLDLKTRTDAMPAAYRAVSTRKPAATDLVPLAQGGEGFLTYAPVRRRDRWEGLVEGILDLDVFGGRYAVPAAPPGHDVTLLSETSDRPFFTTSPRADAAFGPYDFYFTLRFADRRWWAVLHPRSSPSPLALLTGLLLLELGLGISLARRILKP